MTVSTQRSALDVVKESGRSSSPTSKENQRRAKILSATFTKKIARIKLGMVIRQETESHELFVAEMKESGILAPSPIRVGDKLLLVNRKPCTKMEKQEAVELLRGLVGTVTIVAHNEEGDGALVESMVERVPGVEGDGLGVTFAKDSDGRLVVSSVDSAGPFADSLISPGDFVFSVNSTNCQFKTPEYVSDLVKKSPLFVTITAEKKNPSG